MNGDHIIFNMNQTKANHYNWSDRSKMLMLSITADSFQVSAGANLGCLVEHAEDEFDPVYTSSQGTSQIDAAYIDLGFIHNTGK